MTSLRLLCMSTAMLFTPQLKNLIGQSSKKVDSLLLYDTSLRGLRLIESSSDGGGRWSPDHM